MLTPEQVDAIVAQTVAMIKPYYRDGAMRRADDAQWKFRLQGKRTPLPELWNGYNMSLRRREELRVHIEQGAFPEHLIRSRSPNQTDAEYQYVKDNFKQVTLPHYVDYENMIRRALHESNWGMTFEPMRAPEDLPMYLDQEVGSGLGLIQWASSVLIKIKTLDPMGVLCVMPESLPLTEGVNEEGEGVLIMDAQQQVRPEVHYFPCDRVLGYHDDNWFLLWTYEKSVVSNGGKEVREGMVWWLVDESNCWKVEQYGAAYELNFRVSLHFNHDQGYTPVTHMLGVPAVEDDDIMWESRYLPAKDLFDLVLLDSTYLLSSKSSSAYPMRVMIGHQCEYVDNSGHACIGGSLMGTVEGDGMPRSFGTCPSCNGSGVAARLGPHGVLFVKEPGRGGDGAMPKAQDAMTFVEPTATTMDLLRREMTANTNEGRRMLHLHSEVPISGADAATATQVGVGVRAQMAFIKPESDQLFYLIDFVADSIVRQRYGIAEPVYQIIPASQFDLRTEADHLEEISKAISAGLPPSIVEETIRGYLHTRYASDPQSVAMWDTIMRADRLFSVAWANIATMQAKGDVKAWEIALHSDARSIYDMLMEEAGFAAMDLAKKAERMKEYARANFAETTTTNPGRQLAQEIVAATEQVVP